MSHLSSETDLIPDDLRSCIEIPGQSGFEKAIREYLTDKLTPFGEIQFDKLGSIICRIKGLEREKSKWLVAAHMDTCGFIVHSIMANGHVKCVNFGYRDTKALHLHPVAISTSNGLVHGVMNAKTVDQKSNFEIDIGNSRSAKETEDLEIKPGDPIHFTNEPALLGKSTDLVLCAPRLDNRFGIFGLITLARQLAAERPPNDTYLVGTVEEEVGGRGAQTAARKIRPDGALVLDVTYDESPVHLGKGPVLTLSDKSSLVPPHVRDYLLTLGKDSGINLQTEVWNIGGTDAGPVRTVGEGVPTLSILCATRNNHTPSEIGCIKDCFDTVSFCRAILEQGEELLTKWLP
ncbi:MAG: M42 family metallopeptidase [Candidatus Heimdallarchaeota archaeon]